MTEYPALGLPLSVQACRLEWIIELVETIAEEHGGTSGSEVGD